MGALAGILGSVATYWRIVRLLPVVSAPLSLALLGCVALGVIVPLAATLTTGALVGAVPDAVAGGPDTPQARTAAVALAAVGALFVLSRVLGAVRSTFAFSLGRRLDEHLRARVVVALNRPT